MTTPPVQERSFLAKFLALESFGAPAPALIDHLSVHDLALVDYKVGHTLSYNHLGLDSIYLHSQAPCYEIQINY
jgi:hypothetical protein